jgi:hypothetical protein
VSVRPRLKSALLWGAVGCLCFLVALQAYRLAVAPLSFGIAESAAAALVVAAVVVCATYVTEDRLARKGRT